MPKKRKQKDDDDDVYEVEDIVADAYDKKTKEKLYLIKWKGYSDDDNTWEKASDLNCPRIMARYRKRVARKKEAKAKLKQLQDSKNLRHQEKPARKSKTQPPPSKVWKQTVKESSSDSSRGKSKARRRLSLKVTIPLGGLKNGGSSVDSARAEDNTSPLLCHESHDVHLCGTLLSAGNSPLQNDITALPNIEMLPLWETTSADTPVAVNFYDYSNETFSKVSIEAAESNISKGSPIPVDSSFHLTLSPSLSVSSVASLATTGTTSDIDVVDPFDPATVSEGLTNCSADFRCDDGNKSPTMVSITPPHVSPIRGLEVPAVGNASSTPIPTRFRMTSQRVQRHPCTAVDYSALAKGFCNGLASAIKKRNNHLVQPYALRARDYQQELREWCASLNAKCKEKEAMIFVENNYDECPIPKDFEYICTNSYGKGVPNPADHEPVTYCSCQKCGNGDFGCCPMQLESEFAYFTNGRVRVSPGMPIYECNSACSCGPDCCNRVVQKLRSIPLCIFRTGDAKGWGVKAVSEIKKNSFVCEYTGEVIMFDEAERRGAVANAKGLTYLFDLDFHSEDDSCMFSIDASKCGNISHFFNHSCDPNLAVYSVWIDFIDPRLPRIAFFAKRTIHEGEELTFDYQISYNSSFSYEQFSRVKCLCGSKNCQKYLM
ncbi:uncharacterized protein [Dysidea avara]|uniref:uncharacterized protein isoform X2 n=1 Tax=Dysidea avara TaxID=196820 RepID=UPI00332311FF